MVIKMFSFHLSPFCRSVLMTAKLLDIQLDVTDIELSETEQTPELLKVNPAHLIPTIIDDDFVLWESRAILRYLCDKYQPNGTLYPRDVKKRAIVDRWLEFDWTLLNSSKQVVLAKMFLGVEPSEDKIKGFNKHLKVFNQLIGENKYLTGEQLTIADLSLFANALLILFGGIDLTEYPNLLRWSTTLQTELPNFKEIFMSATLEETMAFGEKAKGYLIRKSNE